MTKAVSLSLRALLALLLMLGFYLLALALAGGLLYIPLLLMSQVHQIPIKIGIVCFAAAFAILNSVLPRRDAFESPDVSLTERDHPKLFALLREVAEATRQRVPHEVYLIQHVTAGVSRRGGFLGLGGRRVMFLGMPLLQGLTVHQLRAVLAHEFGHYSGGDVFLGTWVWGMRSIIGRAIQETSRHGAALKFLFLGYGHLFLRATLAVSRHQEFAADRVSARVAGPWAALQALRAVYLTSLAYSSFLQEEVSPVVDAGFRPPLIAGFAGFIASDAVKVAANRAVERLLPSEESDAYDSHPTLLERLTALRKLPAGERRSDTIPAWSLLGDIPDLERRLSQEAIPVYARAPLKAIPWEEVAPKIYLSRWESLARRASSGLRGMTLGNLPEFCGHPEELAKRFTGIDDEEFRGARPLDLAVSAMGAALCVVLQRRRWRILALPGAPVRLVQGEETLEPFGVAERLVSGDVSPNAWMEFCARHGIASVSLVETPFQAEAADPFDDGRGWRG